MTESEIKRRRIKHLKKVKKITTSFLDDNIKIKKKRKNKWEGNVIENNISHLKQIINKVNKELHENALDEHVEEEIRIQDWFAKNGFSRDTSKITRNEEDKEIFQIARYSPRYSIVYDLYWIEDGTIREQMEVVHSSSSPDIFGKYCPAKIEQIENKVIPYLSDFIEYEIICSILKDTIEGFNTKNYITTNILLVTVIESMIRQLCRFVYKNQNSAISDEDAISYVSSFQSLEMLILKGNWTNDIETDIHDAYLQSKYITDESLKKVADKFDRHREAVQSIKKSLETIDQISKSHDVDKLQKIQYLDSLPYTKR